jgi:hypothetical protein
MRSGQFDASELTSQQHKPGQATLRCVHRDVRSHGSSATVPASELADTRLASQRLNRLQACVHICVLCRLLTDVMCPERLTAVALVASDA